MMCKRGVIGLLLITVFSGMSFVCAHAAPPTLSPVHIESDNFHSEWAKVANTITLTFTASENVQSVSVTIAGHSVVAPQLSGGPQSWTATYMMDAGDAEGVVPFSIDFANLTGEWGGRVSSTTDASSVTFDKTPPSTPSAPDLTTLSDTGKEPDDNVTSAIWPMFQGTAGADATEVLLYKDGNWERTDLVTDGAWQVGMNAALTDGTYSMAAKVVDAAGNMSEFSGALSVTVDTTDPQGSGIDLAAGSDTGKLDTDNITRGVNPEFSGMADDLIVGSVASGIWKVEVWSDDGTSGADADGTYYSVTLSTLPEGARTVSGRVYDVAGNTYDLGDLSMLVDRTAPIGSTPDLAAASDTGDSNTDDITQGNTPQFTGTASDPWASGVSSGVWKVEVSSDDGKSATDASGNVAYDVTLANLNEGNRSVTATVYDVAGNTYAAGSLAVTVDRTAPAAPSTPDLTAASDTGMSPSDNITKQTHPMFEGTADTDATQALLFIDGGWERTESMSGGTWLVGVNGALSEGTYSFTAQVLDAAGNLSACSGALSVTVDATAPGVSDPDLADASDTGESNTDGITKAAAPQFIGNATDSGSGLWKVEVAGDDGTSATDDDGTYYSVNLALTEGTRTVSATAYDVAGNSTTSGDLALWIDRTAPSGTVPDLAAASDTGASNTDNLTQGTTPQFTGTAGDGDSGLWKVVVASDDGKSATDASGNVAYDVTLATLNEGNRSVTATMHDVAGNTYTTGALAVTVDRTAPVVQSIVCADSNPTNALSVDFTVTFSEDVTNVDAGDFSIDASGVTGASITSVSGSDVTRTVTVNTGSGNGTLSIDLIDDDSIIDIAGNPLGGSGTGNGNYTNGESYTIDKADPVSSVSSGPSDPSNVANPSFTLSASDTGGSGVAKMECRLTGTATRDWAQCASDGGPVTDDLSGLFAGYTLPTDGSVDGSITLEVKATDAAGNIESTATWTWKYDSTPPDAPSFTGIADDKGSSNTDEKTNDPTLFIFGTAEANSTIEVFRDGTSIGTTAADAVGNWTLDGRGTSLSDGWYSFTATATDAAGNTSVESGPLNVLIDTQAPPTPGGRAPADGTYTNDDPLIFSWSTPTDPGGSGIRDYHIIIYDSTHTQVRGSYPSATNYEPAPLDDGTYTWKLATRDVAGNTGAWSDEWTFVLDTEEPTISSITSSTPDGCYNVGANINVTVNFSEEVTLTGGTLDITLGTGDVVSVTAFGPATSATTTYTVGAGDNSCDLDATGVVLNSGTLQDRAGNDAVIALPTTTIADGSNIVVDTTAPVINPIASDQTVECDGAGNTAELTAWLANNGGAVASDTCCGTDVTWSNNFKTLSDDCGETGSALVTFTATDCCGLSSTTQATFTIEDTINPGVVWNIELPASPQYVDSTFCAIALPILATVTDTCCVLAEDVDVEISVTNATLAEGVGVTQVGNTVVVAGIITVSNLTGCPAVLSVAIDADDCCGNATTQLTDSVEIYDNTIPVINDLMVSNENVDGCCETTVNFTANVTDQCCIVPDNVAVTVTLPTDNAILENIVVNWVQNGQGQVDITGSADVRCLTSCPARVEVHIEATDCCGNDAVPVTSTATEGRVYDETPPAPKDDPNGDEDRSVSDDLEVRADDYGQHRLMVRQDTPVRIDVVYNDSDNCSVCTCEKHLWIDDIVTPPGYGTATIEDAESSVSDPGTVIRYAPYHGYYGRDEFTYRIVDACGNVSQEASVFIEVIAQTVMENLYLMACVDTAVSFDVETTDLWINPDNPGEIPFVFSIFTPPMHGVVSGDLGAVTYTAHGATTEEIESATITLVYTPATGFVGRDALTLRFADPFGGSSTAVVDIAVIECAGQPGEMAPFVVPQGEIFPMIVPLTFVVVYEKEWHTVTVQAIDATGTLYNEALSATWEESIGRYVLRLDTASLPLGLYQMTIPLGNGETVTLMIEVGEAI